VSQRAAPSARPSRLLGHPGGPRSHLQPPGSWAAVGAGWAPGFVQGLGWSGTLLLRCLLQVRQPCLRFICSGCSREVLLGSCWLSWGPNVALPRVRGDSRALLSPQPRSCRPWGVGSSLQEGQGKGRFSSAAHCVSLCCVKGFLPRRKAGEVTPHRLWGPRCRARSRCGAPPLRHLCSKLGRASLSALLSTSALCRNGL